MPQDLSTVLLSSPSPPSCVWYTDGSFTLWQPPNTKHKVCEERLFGHLKDSCSWNGIWTNQEWGKEGTGTPNCGSSRPLWCDKRFFPVYRIYKIWNVSGIPETELIRWDDNTGFVGIWCVHLLTHTGSRLCWNKGFGPPTSLTLTANGRRDDPLVIHGRLNSILLQLIIIHMEWKIFTVYTGLFHTFTSCTLFSIKDTSFKDTGLLYVRQDTCVQFFTRECMLDLES